MQVPAGREIARRAARGRHDPERVLAAEGLARLVDAEERDVLAVGDHETALHEPARRASSAGSPPRADDVDGGRGIESARSPRSAQNAMRFAVGRPREALDRPVAARQAPGPRAGARGLDVEVRVPVEDTPRRRGASRRA